MPIQGELKESLTLRGDFLLLGVIFFWYHGQMFLFLLTYYELNWNPKMLQKELMW